MLVLTRTIEQRIHIGDNVVLTVLAVSGKHVRLGFEAPRSVPIWRAETRREEPGEGRTAPPSATLMR